MIFVPEQDNSKPDPRLQQRIASLEAELSRLRTSEARLRTLFDSMDEGFCVIEFLDSPHGPLSDYIHIEANAAYALNAGIPDVVGQKVREMVPDEADGWVELYGEVLRTGRPIRFERELVATGRHLELSAFRIEPPELKQVAVLFRDVTARKRAEEALRQLNDTLEARVVEAQERVRTTEEALRHSQKLEAVGQLTGGIAHDFNNLLTGIIGSLDLLQLRIQKGGIGDAPRYISAAQGSARRAAALTHRLLAFSRRQTLDARPTDVNKLVRGMEELVSRTVGPQIRVEVACAPNLWETLVDAPQLENALLNLCINARDAMPHGGQITMSTINRQLDEHGAKLRDVPAGDYLVLSVSDTGTGMPPEVIARAFDPFFTTKPLGQGTGLGLSMVYGFVRQSGGQVRIDSDVGRGTTISIYLPRHHGDAEAGQHALPPGGDAQPIRVANILVVDDEPTVRMLAFESLKEWGYNVIEAADGPSGLRLLQTGTQIDLMVTDVGLPGGMNGRQLADAARVQRPHLKVIFMTGYAESAFLDSGALPAGMEVLSKPFAIGDMVVRVRQALES